MFVPEVTGELVLIVGVSRLQLSGLFGESSLLSPEQLHKKVAAETIKRNASVFLKLNIF
jgi:hypothetical protein